VNLRTLLTPLVFVLPVLVVAFSVLMGAYGLAQATEDSAGALVLWWVAMSCLILAAIDLVLLVVVLGVAVMMQGSPPVARAPQTLDEAGHGSGQDSRD